MLEFIGQEYGQSLAFGDCLASQWTEAACLKTWLKNIIWAPYAPDVTSFLQGPDTHEHSQIKADIRSCKGELQWALETEWQSRRNEDPTLAYPSVWGPFECLWVLSKGLQRFKAKSEGRVPLQGSQANQVLRVRPTAEGRLELVKGTETWSHNTLAGRGIAPSLAKRRDVSVALWESDIPPKPDWSQLEGPMLVPDDVPDELEPVFDFEVQSLELTEHQKAMLEPVDARIRNILVPGSIAARAT